MAGGNSSEIDQLRERLRTLEGERASVLQRLGVLESLSSPDDANVSHSGRVTADSPNAEKVALFQSLFAGRSDVYATRWENAKSGRSGYAPACSNEWIAGICNKPRIKCGECPHQAFVPPSANVVEQHLRGNNGRTVDFVVGT